MFQRYKRGRKRRPSVQEDEVSDNNSSTQFGGVGVHTDSINVCSVTKRSRTGSKGTKDMSALKSFKQKKEEAKRTRRNPPPPPVPSPPSKRKAKRANLDNSTTIDVSADTVVAADVTAVGQRGTESRGKSK